MDFDAPEERMEQIIERMRADNPFLVMARSGAAGDNRQASALREAMQRHIGETYDELMTRYLERQTPEARRNYLDRLNAPAESDKTFWESYELLLRQLYNLPVSVETSLISFQEAVQKLQQDEIERWEIDPLMQPLAGPPTSPNRIITLIGKDALKWYVKAKYDPKTQQIYSPEA